MNDGTSWLMSYAVLMPERPSKPKTQKTPKGAKIPVPTRGQVYRDLAEMAKPQKPDRPAGPCQLVPKPPTPVEGQTERR